MKKKYKRMLEGMQKKKSKRKSLEESWTLYMLRCSDGSLYTGVTKDLDRRVQMHNKGTASKYTRTRGPVEVVYTEDCLNRTNALVRECEVKSFSKKKKEDLVLTRKEK